MTQRSNAYLSIGGPFLRVAEKSRRHKVLLCRKYMGLLFVEFSFIKNKVSKVFIGNVVKKCA